MDQKQKSFVSQFTESQFLKRVVTKLILSVSVFSLFFSHPTLLSFLHYLNFHLSTLPFKLFSHTLDKNCTFLLCNGLLVFVANYSGSSSSSSNNNECNLTDPPPPLESFKDYEDDNSQPQMTIMEIISDEVPLMLEQDAGLESTQTTQQNQNATQQENENENTEAEKTETETEETQEDQEKEEEEEEIAVPEEDKEIAETEAEAEEESKFFIEGGGGGIGKWSNEELNKKCDEFIRKMKEELRIEARQQLIMV